MQTMNFARVQAVVCAVIFILSLMTVVSALLALAGLSIGLLFLVPLGLMYSLLYGLRFLEWIGGKKKPLAEQVDQGRKAARPLG
jgi:hypothetical protein